MPRTHDRWTVYIGRTDRVYVAFQLIFFRKQPQSIEYPFSCQHAVEENTSLSGNSFLFSEVQHSLCWGRTFITPSISGCQTLFPNKTPTLSGSNSACVSITVNQAYVDSKCCFLNLFFLHCLIGHHRYVPSFGSVPNRCAKCRHFRYGCVYPASWKTKSLKLPH